MLRHALDLDLGNVHDQLSRTFVGEWMRRSRPNDSGTISGVIICGDRD
jgi:hypothetical protein